MKSYIRIWLVIVLGALVVPARAHEAPGRAGDRTSDLFQVETELYAGRRGYLHGGLGLVLPIGPSELFGLTTHFVREESGADVFPSIGAEYSHAFKSGLEIKAAGFRYVPVDGQHAWSATLRATHRFSIGEHVTVAPFFGPTWARVRTVDELTDGRETIHHMMLFGGVAVHAERMEVSVFASHSLFSRDPGGLVTPVDLEEMTHFAAYENNDGFVRDSAGVEASYSFTRSFSVAVRYAAIIYDDDTSHSVAIVPAFQVTKRLRVFGGVQFLRRQESPNDLGTLGFALSF